MFPVVYNTHNKFAHAGKGVYASNLYGIRSLEMGECHGIVCVVSQVVRLAVNS